MNPIHKLVEELKKRPDVGVVEKEQSWLVVISKDEDLSCEVIIPHDVLEWYVSIKHRGEKKEIWSDWMDYSGYNDRSREKLEAEMAEDILAFTNRISIEELRPPFQIYLEKEEKPRMDTD